jgi:hypothetical protein
MGACGRRRARAVTTDDDRARDAAAATLPGAAAHDRTSDECLRLRAWIIGAICGIVYRSTANRRPGAPRLGWPCGDDYMLADTIKTEDLR